MPCRSVLWLLLICLNGEETMPAPSAAGEDWKKRGLDTKCAGLGAGVLASDCPSGRGVPASEGGPCPGDAMLLDIFELFLTPELFRDNRS
jgi:hypothetical protein